MNASQDIAGAQDALIESHLGFAESRVRWFWKHSRGWRSYDELLSTAYAGLVVAARKFDPSQEVMFRTYAMWVIDQHIRDERRADMVAAGFKRNKHGKGMIQMVHVEQWPNQPSGDPVDVASEAPTQEDTLIQENEIAVKREAVLSAAGDVRERRILEQRLEGQTQAEIADTMGLSESRVSQLTNRAVSRVGQPVVKRPRAKREPVESAPVVQTSDGLLVRALRDLESRRDDMDREIAALTAKRDGIVAATDGLRAIVGVPNLQPQPQKRDASQPRRRLATRTGTLGQTQASIIAELARREPQTAADLQSRIRDVQTVGWHCSLMAEQGFIVRQRAPYESTRVGRAPFIYARTVAAFKRGA